MPTVQRGHGSLGSRRTSWSTRCANSELRTRLGLPTDIVNEVGYELVEERLSLPEGALRVIAELPDADRQVLDLRVVEGCPYKVIAARLNCTQVAARLRVSRALRRLNIALGAEP